MLILNILCVRVLNISVSYTLVCELHEKLAVYCSFVCSFRRFTTPSV